MAVQELSVDESGGIVQPCAWHICRLGRRGRAGYGEGVGEGGEDGGVGEVDGRAEGEREVEGS